MSRNEVPTNLNDLNLNNTTIMYQAMIDDSISYAQSLMSDDCMTEKEYEQERDKAKKILTGAIATILRNSHLYGSDSIYQVNNSKDITGAVEINTFFNELVNEVCNESFNIKR